MLLSTAPMDPEAGGDNRTDTPAAVGSKTPAAGAGSRTRHRLPIVWKVLRNTALGMTAMAATQSALQSTPSPRLTETQLVADVSGLISPPALCAEMFALIQAPHSSSKEIGELVALDPNLTSRLLRIVNSSYYGFPSQIDTMARAITILGVRDLYNLVLAISAVRSLSALGAGLVPIERFWQHSIFGALVARQLAKRFGLEEPDRLFVAGLLHDVGSPVIYTRLPDLADSMRQGSHGQELSLYRSELEQLGFTHASVGAKLLETWQLPSSLRNAIRHHHDFGGALEDARESAILYLADVFANRTSTGVFCPESDTMPEINPAVWDLLGTGPDALDEEELIESVNTQFAEMVAVFLRR